MKKNAKNSKKIGRAPAWLWYPAKFFVGLYYRLKYRVSIDNSAIKGHKGPALVLAVHTSGKDHVFAGMAIPGRSTFVLSEHFYTVKGLRSLLVLLKTVPKKMFCPDTRSVTRMIRAVREGNTVILFPEGRLTWYSRSLEITEGTAELVRYLGVDVFTLVADGAGRTFPKWSASGPRRGRISVRIEKLFDGSEVKEMPVESIDAKIREALRHDEDAALPDVAFRSRDTSAGLDRILWVCPACGREIRPECAGGHVRCPACGSDARLDEYGVISGLPERCGIRSVGDFYEFCASTVNTDEPLEMTCAVSATDAKGYMARDIGLGKLVIDRENVTFSGTVEDENVVLSRPTADIRAFPVSLGDHIDIYFNSRLYLFSPLPDRRDVIRAVAYLDRVTAQRKQ